MTGANDALDSAAFEALYVRLEKRVFNTVYRWVWSRDEARDVTQEAFMKLWSMRHAVQLATVEPLLFRTALNLASNRLRARKIRRFFSLDAPSEAPSAEVDLEAHQRRLLVRRAVDALPEKLKAVVMLFEFSGLDTAQIAAALSIPPGTVSSRRSLAMAALSKTLGEDVTP